MATMKVEELIDMISPYKDFFIKIDVYPGEILGIEIDRQTSVITIFGDELSD